jgi:acetyltransferase-like isoleucine patch superfamily enzyme
MVFQAETAHQFDPTASISPLADLERSTRGSRLIVGPRAMIDAFVKVKFAGGAGDVVIGEDSHLNSGCVVYSGAGVRLGVGVRVAANCTFATPNHAYMDADIPIRRQGFLPDRGGIVIEDDVWIGANCVLLDGALIRRGAVIAAGSIIRGEAPAFHVMGGNPLRVLKVRTPGGKAA